eukprot:scaffold39283_cov168-Skeletonema_marinoi.AAC.2
MSRHSGACGWQQAKTNLSFHTHHDRAKLRPTVLDGEVDDTLSSALTWWVPMCLHRWPRLPKTKKMSIDPCANER